MAVAIDMITSFFFETAKNGNPTCSAGTTSATTAFGGAYGFVLKSTSAPIRF